MKNEKIISAWNHMNPDNATKENMLRQIQSTFEAKHKPDVRADMETNIGTTVGTGIRADNRYTARKPLARFAIGFSAAFILLLGSLGTAYAASPAFRDYVRALLFPLYTSDEFVSIENGHLTGPFDKTDVLLSFLDRFNRMEFGNSITAAMENGYHYSLFAQDEDQLQAFVDSNVDGYCIVVSMEQLEYEDTEGIWQITGYQILESTAAETVKSGLTPYSEPLSHDTASTPQEGASIQAAEDTMLIYNVNEKQNTASLTENDSKVIRDILDSCDRLENIEGGLFQYVIKVNDISYLFDSQGRGMISESASHQGVAIAQEDLRTILDMFERYGISLNEIE